LPRCCAQVHSAPKAPPSTTSFTCQSPTPFPSTPACLHILERLHVLPHTGDAKFRAPNPRPSGQRRPGAQYLRPRGRRLRLRTPTAQCKRPPRLPQDSSTSAPHDGSNVSPPVFPAANLPQSPDPRSQPAEPVSHITSSAAAEHIRVDATGNMDSLLHIPPLAPAARRRQRNRRLAILAHRYDAKAMLHNGCRDGAAILGNGAMGARSTLAPALDRNRKSWTPRHECEDCCYTRTLVERDC
jgi:hypothetical protein